MIQVELHWKLVTFFTSGFHENKDLKTECDSELLKMSWIQIWSVFSRLHYEETTRKLASDNINFIFRTVIMSECI